MRSKTKSTLWAIALKHCRLPHFFDALITPEEFDEAVSDLTAKLPVTREEVFRACRYAAIGYEDAQVAKIDGDMTHRTNKEEAAMNLAAFEERIA